MRHRKAGIKLNRTSSHRNAMFRNMVTSLFKHDRIQTTDAKAKELRRWADHLVTLAKRGDLHARRQALGIIREKDVVHKLFENAAERFGAVSGGYTRIVKLKRRPGDAAPVSLVELISAGDVQKKKKRKKTRAAESAAAPAAPAGETKEDRTEEAGDAEEVKAGTDAKEAEAAAGEKAPAEKDAEEADAGEEKEEAVDK